MLAGILASYALGYLVGVSLPKGFELPGATLVVLAVMVLGSAAISENFARIFP